LTAEGTTSKWTGSISCEVEFCIFYRHSLRTLRTKDLCNFVVWNNSSPRAFAISLLGLWAHAQLDTHNDAPQTVGLLWTSDQIDSEAATYETQNKHKGRTSMTPAEFETTIPASKWPQTHASTHAFIHFTLLKWPTCSSHRLYCLRKFAQIVAILFSWCALFFRISTGTSNILSEVLCSFPQSFQENLSIIQLTQIRLWLFYLLQFALHSLLVIRRGLTRITEGVVK
jgi:hypothetical protein